MSVLSWTIYEGMKMEYDCLQIARLAFVVAIGSASVEPGMAQVTHKTLNSFVQSAVEMLSHDRAGGGYNIDDAFTQNLDYGTDKGVIIATDKLHSPPKPTMCVAASAEVIVEALNAFSKKTGDMTAFKLLPYASWNSGKITSIRANVFMYAGTNSRGTGHALSKLGIGEEKTFDRLLPYDFINLNREHSGHSAVFISYLDKDYNELTSYSSKVAGFKYFSAQGNGKPDAGFAFRYAFFEGFCPPLSRGKPRDCGVIKKIDNLALLDGGELWAPAEWKIEEAQNKLRADLRLSISNEYQGAAPSGFVDTKLEELLNRELEPTIEFFSGETTD